MIGDKACGKQWAAIGSGARRRAGITTALAMAFGALSSPVHAAPATQSAPAAMTRFAPACAKTLPNIQQCINSAAWSSMKAKDTAALAGVADRLRSGMKKDRGPSLYYRTYWLAYADYRAAVLAIAEKRMDSAKPLLSEADELLDKLAVKDKETYALQDLVLLLRFAVAPPAEIGPLVSRTSELRGKLANATSVRALYALAVADHYTPKQYGGGRVAESLLRQALASPEEMASPLKPTWGRDDCAALLIQILRQAGSNDQATNLYNQWHQRYPDSIALAQVSRTP